MRLFGVFPLLMVEYTEIVMINRIVKNEIAAQQGYKSSQAGGKRTADFRGTMEANQQPRQLWGARPTGKSNISMLHAQRLAQVAPIIKYQAAKYGVPVELVAGVIVQESGGNPKAKSHAGASGLMQLMPATARRMGVTHIFDPAQNIEGGVKYLRMLLDLFNGNVEHALAGYNAGEGNVKKYGGIPPFKETQNYVPSVLQHTRAISAIINPNGGTPDVTNQSVRGMVQSTMPRHSVANFSTEDPTPKQPSPQQTNESLANRLARI